MARIGSNSSEQPSRQRPSMERKKKCFPPSPQSVGGWARMCLGTGPSGGSLCLCYKTSLSAKPSIWKWVLHAVSFSCKTNWFWYDFALRLTLKQRHVGTRKWPIWLTDMWLQSIGKLFFIVEINLVTCDFCRGDWIIIIATRAFQTNPSSFSSPFCVILALVRASNLKRKERLLAV